MELEATSTPRGHQHAKPVSESSDKTSIEHANSLKIGIYEVEVISGESRELKRKLLTEDQKTDDENRAQQKRHFDVRKKNRRTAMDQHKEQEDKILKNGLKIKSLENANELLYNGVLELGGSMFRMMDEMEKSWKNKMSSLNRKTEAVEGKVGLLNEVLTKQKQDHKDGILEVERRAQLFIDSSQKVVVEIQENLRNALDEKEKNDKEYDFALQAQHWITDEKEEEWALSNQCLELEKAELKMNKAKLMEKINREKSKALFYETEYNKAMGSVAEVQKMVAKFGTPLTFEEYEKKAEYKVMSGESRELKRKLSTEDQKTDDEKIVF